MANKPLFDRLAIVGVGLIGGSIGLAAKDHRVARHIVGVGRRMESLQIAQQRGAIDEYTTDLASGIQAADLAVVCTPVDSISKFVHEIASLRGADILITDAGSTKAGIVDQVEQPKGSTPVRFVGGHPLAGDHNTGPEHARADLFAERMVIVTPTRRTAKADAEAITEFWTRLGAVVETMSPEKHDKLVSVTSHAPHLLAAALAAETPEAALAWTGAGWRDTTRIAAGDPAMWRQIALANRQNIAEDLRRIEIAVESMRAALDEADGRRLEAILRKAKRNRDAVGS